MDRRAFLRRAATSAASGALGLIAAACGSPSAAARPSTRHRPSTKSDGVHEVDGLQVADWVVEENRHPGATLRGIIPRSVSAPYWYAPIEGYLSQVSAKAGEVLTLYVSTAAASYRAFIYRIGYYGGAGGRHVAQSPELTGVVQPAPHLTAGVNMIECAWAPSWSFEVGKDWPPGYYLIRLEASSSEQRHVPFVVRDDSSHAAYLVQSSVTTWQAYNPYGGYSLYGGPGADSLANRSRVVSFNRPYGHDGTALDPRGSGDFLGNEFPLAFLAERHGLDVSYWTDVDLHARPALLANHASLISLGHDEYWSLPMRDAVETEISKGLNVAFLGANACYRQIRFEAGAGVADRRVICYKDATEDPITATDPALATGGSWATDPVKRPESALVGVMYQSYGGSGPMIVRDAGSWVFAGTGLANGAHLPGIIGSEFDGFEPASGRPPGPVQVLTHSPTNSVSGHGYSDMSYYSVNGAGGVFATGTASWVRALWDGPAGTRNRLGFSVLSDVVTPLSRITLNVLGTFGERSAGKRHPSVANWRQFYSSSASGLATADVP